MQLSQDPLLRKRTATAFLVLLCLSAAASHAWRETGHFAVCEIAYRNLVPEARAKVDEITGGKDFATQCTWPDMVRDSEDWGYTYNWHFINLDDGQEYFAAGNVNPKGDVLQALLLAEAKLQSAATAQDERLIYLRFLGHFAGDSHQPLHVGRKSDLGGNNVRVTWFGEDDFESTAIVLSNPWFGSCKRWGRHVDEATGECVKKEVSRRSVNLHKVWDLLMIQRFLDEKDLRADTGDSEFLHKAYATAVEGMLDRGEGARAVAASFWDWVSESLADRAAAYDVGDGALDEGYYRKNIDGSNRRIALAGHRLAFTLNRILAPSGDSPETAELAARHRELRERIVALAGEDSPLASGLPSGTASD